MSQSSRLNAALASAARALVLLICLGLAACGGGGGDAASSPPPVGDLQDDAATPPDPPQDDATADDPSDGGTAPPDSAPSLKLASGDYWEYGWDTLSAVSIPGSNSVTERAGRFRLTLGEAINLDGREGFEVQISGEVLGEVPRAFAVEDDLLYASFDSARWTLLFSTSASWTGGGWFLSLPDGVQVTAESNVVDNDYLAREALAVGTSEGTDLCETLNGQNFCDEATTYREFEYYDPQVGVIAYRYQYDTLEAGLGGAITNTRINVGLIASSLQDDVVDYALEIEPNNSPLDNAVPLRTGERVLAGAGDELANGGEVNVVVVEVPAGASSEMEPNDTPAQATPVSLFETIAGAISSEEGVSRLSVRTDAGEVLELAVNDLYLLDFSDLPVVRDSDQPHGDCPTLGVTHSRLASGALQLTVLAREDDGLRLVAQEANDSDNGLSSRPTLFAGTDYLLAVGASDLPAITYYTINLACTRELPPEPERIVERVLNAFDWYEVNLASEGALEVVANGASFVITNEDPTVALGEAVRDGEEAWRFAEVLPAGIYRIGITSLFERAYDISAFY